MPDIDLAGLMRGLDAATNSITASMNDFVNSLSIGSEAGATQQTGIQAEATAKQQIEAIKSEAAIKRNKDIAGATAALGTNPDATSYVIQAMNRDILIREKDADNRLAMIQQKMDVGFLDDPLNWLVNQVTLPADIASYNTAVVRLDSKQKNLGTILKLTTEEATALSVIDESQNASMLAATNAKIAAEAMINVAKSQKEMAQLGIQGAQVRAVLAKAPFELLYQYNNAVATQEHLMLQRSAGQRAEETLQLQREFRDIQLLEKTDKMAAEKAFQQKLDGVFDTLGMSRMSIKEFAMLGGPLRAKIEQLVTDPDIARGVLSNNTAQAFELANDVGAKLTEGMNISREKMARIKADVIASEPNWHQMKPDEKLNALQKALTASMASELKSIKTSGGFYSPPPLMGTLSIPIVAQSLLGKELANVAVADAQYPTNPDVVFKMANDLIATGKASPAQMADEISTMFKAVQLDLNEKRLYKRWGMPLLSDKTGYRMSFFTGLGWKGTDNIDLTNKAAVETTLTRIFNASKQGPLGVKPSTSSMGDPVQYPEIDTSKPVNPMNPSNPEWWRGPSIRGQ